MGIVTVWQKVDVEAERHVTDSRDLVLRRTPGVENTPWGECQLLQGVETQTLEEGPLNLGGHR